MSGPRYLRARPAGSPQCEASADACKAGAPASLAGPCELPGPGAMAGPRPGPVDRGVTRRHTAIDWAARWWCLAQGLSRWPDRATEDAMIERLLATPTPFVLGFVNAHAMNLCVRELPFFDDLIAADMLLRDGIGMAWLLRALGLPPGRNLNGTDFIPRLLEHGGSRRVLLLGTTQPWLSRAQCALQARGLPCEAAHGFLSAQDYARLAQAWRPQIIVLGMGMPRQESVARTLRAALSEPCLIVCGGAIIDFLGGRVRRAPLFMRLLRLEWMWRLACEPRRLFRRYVIGNPLFLARAARVAWRASHQAAPWASDAE